MENTLFPWMTKLKRGPRHPRLWPPWLVSCPSSWSPSSPQKWWSHRPKHERLLDRPAFGHTTSRRPAEPVCVLTLALPDNIPNQCTLLILVISLFGNIDMSYFCPKLHLWPGSSRHPISMGISFVYQLSCPLGGPRPSKRVQYLCCWAHTRRSWVLVPESTGTFLWPASYRKKCENFSFFNSQTASYFLTLNSLFPDSLLFLNFHLYYITYMLMGVLRSFLEKEGSINE